MKTITEFNTLTVLDTLDKMQFQNKVWVVYNDSEYFIHNGIDTLVMLKGASGDYHITLENMISTLGNTGTHWLAEAKDLNGALDAYNEWLKTNYKGK